MALLLTDIPPGSGGGAASDSVYDTPTVATQRFSVDFRVDDTVDEAVIRTQELGNLVKRARSGNPGYLTGMPLLAGALETWGKRVKPGPGQNNG